MAKPARDQGEAAGNLLLSPSILLNGATYTKIASLAEFLKLNFLSEKTFYNIQDLYLFPVIMRYGKGNKGLFLLT